MITFGLHTGRCECDGAGQFSRGSGGLAGGLCVDGRATVGRSCVFEA